MHLPTERNLAALLDRLFGRRADRMLKVLAETEPLRGAIQKVEEGEVKRRSNLFQQLNSLPKRHEPVCIAAYEAVLAAREELDRANVALNDASVKYAQAQGRLYGVSSARDRERTVLERELVETADPRLENFAVQCEGLRASLERFDAMRCEGAFRALTDAAQRARAMKLQPLRRDQVTSTLARLSSELLDPLARLDRVPPQVESSETAGAGLATGVI